MMYAPVVAIVYRRPCYTHRMLSALAKNFLAKETEVFVFSNAASTEANDDELNDVSDVRNAIKEFDESFLELHIIERFEHLSANESICQSIDEVISEYGKAIVLEEDIVTSHDFLDFMNQALDYYEDDQRVFDVLAMNPLNKAVNCDAFFSYSFMPWGWGTWKDRWESVDWERHREHLAQIDLQAIRQYAPAFDVCIRHELSYGKSNIYLGYWDYSYVATKFRQEKFSVIAAESKALNIGDEGEGENLVLGNLPHEFAHLGRKREFHFRDVWAKDIYTATEISIQAQMYGYTRNRGPWEINNSAMHEVFFQWLMMKIACPHAISNYLKGKNLRKIAVHGMGRGGYALYNDLREVGIIEVAYGIDRNKRSDFPSLAMFSIEDDLPEVDAIIVTSSGYFYEIYDELSEKVKCPVISLIDIIDRAYRQFCKKKYSNLSFIF